MLTDIEAPDAWYEGWKPFFEETADHYFPHQVKLPDPDAFAALLCDIPLELVRAAVLRLVQSARWFPTVAEIREAAATLVVAQQPTASEAFRTAVDEISAARAHARPMRFGNPLIARVVRDLGPRAILEGEAGVMLGHFRRAWEDLVEREKLRNSLTPQVAAALEAAAPELPALAGAPLRALPSPAPRFEMPEPTDPAARLEEICRRAGAHSRPAAALALDAAE